jgi:hypothetical protein
MGARLREHVRTNLVGYIALMVAVAGVPTAWGLARNSVGSQEIEKDAVKAAELAKSAVRSSEAKNDALKGKDVVEASFGRVPSAESAQQADTATNADSAEDADALGGIGPNGYVQTPTEATRLVGTPGNPAFAPGWANDFTQGTEAGFYKDQFGIVHLQGLLDPPGFSGTIFTLPPGYRPIHRGATGLRFAVPADATTGVVEVLFTGDVRAPNSFNNTLSLDGITFRAAE